MFDTQHDVNRLTSSKLLQIGLVGLASILPVAGPAQALPFGSWEVQPSGQIFFFPSGGGNPAVVYNGDQRALRLIVFKDFIYTAFDGGGIYRSPDGQNLGGGGQTSKVYSGSQLVRGFLICKDSLYTAFSGAGIYRSRDGMNLGGGGSTVKVYSGSQLVTKWLCSDQTGNVVTTFSGGGVYESRDGNNLGGGGNTIRLN